MITITHIVFVSTGGQMHKCTHTSNSCASVVLLSCYCCNSHSQHIISCLCHVVHSFVLPVLLPPINVTHTYV